MEALNSTLLPDFSALREIVYTLWERVKQEMFQNLEIEEKSWAELVTRIDKLIELEARKRIKAQYWKVNFLWEEFPDENNGSDITFIIDPLDGTESFIHREFNTTISIWVEVWWKLIHGLVYDFMKNILYEGWTESFQYIGKRKIPLLRWKCSNKTRVLVSGRWQEVEDIQSLLKENPLMQVTRAYGSVALQAVQTGSGNYEWYVRVWKIKKWDIAWAAPFINSLDDTHILSREWNAFNHHSPEAWVIVVRDTFRDDFLTILDI